MKQYLARQLDTQLGKVTDCIRVNKDDKGYTESILSNKIIINSLLASNEFKGRVYYLRQCLPSNPAAFRSQEQSSSGESLSEDINELLSLGIP